MHPDLSTGREVGLRERARRQREASVLRAAQDLFVERGFHHVTTKQIAERAEVGEATLFRMVRSKSELLMWVFHDRVHELVAEIEAIDRRAPRGDAASYLRRIYQIYERRGDLFVEDPGNMRALVLEAFAADSPLQSPAMSSGDRTIALVAGIVTEGQARGVLRDDVDAETVALNCNGAYVHEVCRSQARGHAAAEFSARLGRRLRAQLEPLAIEII